jgi:hypothetical protein
VVLIRRPGRAPDGDRRAPAWAFADTRAGRTAVAWGTWRDPHALMEVDLRMELDVHGPVPPSGPQRVALVCTHARHDICCAVRGRPVAAALAAQTDWDVWECSHLGGDRFAANLLLLPSGELFGGLDPQTGADVVRRFDAGHLALENWRGRYGRSAVEQAALHRAAVALGDDRRGAVRVRGIEERPGEQWGVEVEHVGAGGVVHRYLMHLSVAMSRPHLLTCGAVAPSRMRTFDLDAELEPVGAGQTERQDGD